MRAWRDFDGWSWPGKTVARAKRARPLLSASHANAFAVLAIWAVWAGAVVATVAIGVAAGAYDRGKAFPGTYLFPFFSWDFGWYEAIAGHGYGSVVSQRYAFFPLWPWLIRASGSIPDWQWAGVIALLASGAAFLGVAAGSPAKRPRQAAVALACWPGSFALLLAYPDGLALACAAWAGALVLYRRPLAAIPLGAAAAMLRPTGLVIALPLALLARGRGPFYWLAAAAPIAAGAAVEVVFWTESGDASAFLDAQKLGGARAPRGSARGRDTSGSAPGRMRHSSSCCWPWPARSSCWPTAAWACSGRSPSPTSARCRCSSRRRRASRRSSTASAAR